MTGRRFIDLNLGIIQTHTSIPLWKELMDEFRKNDIRSIDGLRSLRLRVSLLRRAIPRPVQDQKFFLLGSVSNPRLCAAHLSRESQRHRSVSASSATKTLSYGSSRSCVAQHLGQRQSGPRLENLRRLCPYTYSGGTRPLQGRALWYRTRPDRLCTGCNHHRFMPVSFSLGSVPPTQIGRQASHLAGSSRQYSHRGHRHRWSDPRGQHSRSVDLGSWSHLPDGPRLCRFSKTVSHASIGSILCDSGQKTIRLSAPVFPNSGQKDRFAMRSDRCPQQPYPQAWLSRAASSSALLRCDKPKASGFLTNNFLLPALTITQLYRCRWQVELFFRWIKQHLRIKAFYGTSENAVRTQVWIAIAVYVLVAIVKKRLNLERSLHSILQILSVSLFGKIPIVQALSQPECDEINYESLNQLILFD